MKRLLRNRYQVIEAIGEGSEGRVVRAVDRQHGRTVALKIRTAPSGGSTEDLLREARVLLSLDPHPGLPLVREDFFEGDEYVIVMDWIEGIDLGRLLRERGTPGLAPSSVLRHLAQVSEALTYLHMHDPTVIHGDVKPANIILTSSGKVVLVDFGIASAGVDRAGRVGTRGFIAPEVAAGRAHTPASDVYSLAMTAFTLLTGNDHAGGHPVWPAEVDRERARVFERAIDTATSTDPRRRPSSTGEFLELLRAGWDADYPTGVLTFCMTGIDGSTSLWETHPTAMATAVVRHEAIVAQAAESHRGRVIRTMGEGDSTASVFVSAIDAVPAAVDMVRMIGEETWPDGLDLRVRIGLHTGSAETRLGDHLGPAASRAARARDLADARQVFLSEATARVVQDHIPAAFGLVDLGLHTLRGSSVREHIYALSAPSVLTPPSPAACPYRGLLAYEPEDADVYFGREAAVVDLLSRVACSRFVAVVGPSGSGKSSLVRAGLVPAVRRGDIEGVTAASVVTPGSDPVQALTAAIAAGKSDADRLLVVDQFEEAFTLCGDGDARARFVELLMGYGGRVAIALRADFFGHCAAHENLREAVAANTVLLGPLGSDDLRRAIRGPAERAGLSLEPGLVEVIVRDVGDEPGSLPLLSHALMETWARRDGRRLTVEGYDAAGGVSGAIARTADDVFMSCTQVERDLVKRIFIRLTELGDGTDDTRRRANLHEFLSENSSATAGLLETLTQARLLSIDGDVAEVAHEALIREWPRLRAWLNEDREGLRLRRHLTKSADAWERRERDSGDLYRGTRLASALEWSGDRDEMSTLEQEFLDASVAEQEAELRTARRQNRRLRATLSGVAAALVLALVAGALALLARGNAQHSAVIAQSGRLAAQSREIAAKHPDMGLLLALEAVRLRSSVDTRGALLGALERGGRIAGELQGLEAPPNQVAFSPDGKLLATVGVDGTRLWDVATHRTIGPPLRSNQGGWQGAAFSPDGRTLAIGGEHGNVELWDVSSKKLVRDLLSPGGSWLARLRYSPNGKVIAAAGREDNHITLFDAASGRVLGRPIAPHSPGTSAGWFAFSPDSTLIAMIADNGQVGFWTVATQQPAHVPFVGDGQAVSMSFMPDGRALVVGEGSGSVSIWEIGTGQRLGKALSVGDQTVDGIAVSPDGRLIAAGSNSGSIFVWDATTRTAFGSPLGADATPVWDVAFSPDGQALASAADRSAVLWDLSGRHAIGEPIGPTSDVSTGVAFRPDGMQLALGEYDGSVAILDVTTRKELKRIDAGSTIFSVAYSPDGKLLAAGSTDGKVRFWDAVTWSSAGAPIDAGKVWVWQVAFSPDSKTLAVAADPNGPRNFFLPDREGEAQLWDVASRRRVGKAMVPGKHSILSVAFSPDGRLLGTGSFEDRLELWNVADQSQFGHSMDVQDDGIATVAFAPGGKRVVGGELGVRIWDVTSQRLAAPPLPGASALGAAFDSRGRFLATTAFGATKLWDPTTGLAYGESLEAGPKPASLQTSVELNAPFLPARNAFSPDGRFLATAGVDTFAMLWDLDLATWRDRACDIAGRNLTREEWRVYLPTGAPYRATCLQWPAA